VQPCIAAIRYAEAACSSGTFEFIHISSSVRVPRRQDLLFRVSKIQENKQQSTKQLTANLADEVHELMMKCE
jgi:hypothetical protein